MKNEKWKAMPFNGMEGQPCPFGCLLLQRTSQPYDYRLEGDCRAPWSAECCMNRQEKEK